MSEIVYYHAPTKHEERDCQEIPASQSEERTNYDKKIQHLCHPGPDSPPGKCHGRGNSGYHSMVETLIAGQPLFQSVLHRLWH